LETWGIERKLSLLSFALNITTKRIEATLCHILYSIELANHQMIVNLVLQQQCLHFSIDAVLVPDIGTLVRKNGVEPKSCIEFHNKKGVAR
jgi:hypothetical protein